MPQLIPEIHDLLLLPFCQPLVTLLKSHHQLHSRNPLWKRPLHQRLHANQGSAIENAAALRARPKPPASWSSLSRIHSASSQPKPVTIADSGLDPKALPPLVAAPERSPAAALQDVLERMSRSRERGNIAATQHVSMLPIAQWRTDRPNLATEKTPLIATLASPVAPSNTLSVTPIAPPAPSVLSINHPALPVLSPVSTPQTATGMRKDQRLYRERGTPRKARNAPFIIKPPGCAGDIPTPVVFKKSKLGVTDKIEGGEENGGC